MDLPKRAFIFALSQHSIRWLGTQRARSTDNRGWKNGVERLGDAYRRVGMVGTALPRVHGFGTKGCVGAINKGTFPDVQRRIAQERVPTTPIHRHVPTPGGCRE